jgi:hypothetical protein
VQTAKADLEIARVLAKQGLLEEAEARVASSGRVSRNVSIGSVQEEIDDHTLLVKGLILKQKGHLASACRLLWRSLSENDRYDPSLRQIAVKELAEMLGTQGLSSAPLNEYLEAPKLLKDVVVLDCCCDCSATDFSTVSTSLKATLKTVLRAGDQLGLVSAGSPVKLSKNLSRVKSVSSDSIAQYESTQTIGPSNLFKGLKLALRVLRSACVAQPDFNGLLELVDFAQPARKQWVIVLVTGLGRTSPSDLTELLR